MSEKNIYNPASGRNEDHSGGIGIESGKANPHLGMQNQDKPFGY